METKIEFFGHLAPGRNWLTISTDQEGARSGSSGPVWKNRNGGTCIDQKLLLGDRILEEDEAAESIELPTAAT